MRNFPAPLKTHLLLEVTTLCWLWRITRRDGAKRCFSSLDVDITYDGDVYYAETGFDGSAVLSALNSNYQGMTLTVFVEDGENSFTQEELEEGVYNNAQCDVFLCNYMDADNTAVLLAGGKLGEATINDGRIAEIVVDPIDKGEKELAIDIYSTKCRADLGDAQCGVDIESMKIEITVDTLLKRQQVGASEIDGPIDTWAEGTIVFTSGRNNGVALEIATSVNNIVTLYAPPPFKTEIGDTAELYPGCAKTLRNCKVYDNVVNYRGEPFKRRLIPASESDPAATDDTGGGTTVTITEPPPPI